LIAQIQQPTTMQGIVSIVNTLVTWLTPALLAWVVRVQINNGKRAREEAAAQRKAEADAAKAAVEVARNVEEAQKATVEVAKKVGEAQEATVEVARKVGEVVEVAAATAKVAADTAEKSFVVIGQVHTLVNSKMGLQLKKTARKSRDLANAIPTPENIKDAEEAEQELADHVSKQKESDENVRQQQQQQQQQQQ